MDDRVLLTQPGSPIPTDFVTLAGDWCANYSTNLLNFVWQGYDLLLKELPAGINDKDLERSICESLELRIRRAMSGYEPFDIQHEPSERETMLQPPARAKQYDLAFKLRAQEWIMWPLEAKVLETDGAVGDYKNDVNNEFLTCRYAPFSSEGAMLGYLLKGSVENVFRNLEEKIPCSLAAHPDLPNRPCKMSDHVRQVEAGRPYPSNFRCYHLILEFPEIVRWKKRVERESPEVRSSRRQSSRKRSTKS